MPDHDLTLRTEQAFIGALLRDPRNIDDVAYLPANRLTHPTYQAVYQNLRDLNAAAQATPTTYLPDLVAADLRAPGVTSDYLRALAAACPDPDHAAVYARMIQEAYIRSTLAAYATNQPPTQAGDQATELYNSALTRALGRQGYHLAEHDHVPAPALTEPATGNHVPTDERAQREEMILADLIQHQDQIAEVEPWLTSDVFVPGPHRELYETILTVDGYDEPVSELTIEWELSRRRSLSRPDDTGAVADATTTPLDRPDITPGYLTHLMNSDVAIGTAVELGAELLTDSVRDTVAQRAETALATVHNSHHTAPTNHPNPIQAHTHTHTQNATRQAYQEPPPPVGPASNPAKPRP